MSGVVHLVGAFSGLSPRNALSLQAELLGDRLIGFSDARVNGPVDWQDWLTAVLPDQDDSYWLLPYAGQARAAHDAFRALALHDAAPPGRRLQTSFPVAVARRWHEPFGQSDEIDVRFNVSLVRQIGSIVETNPVDEVAIQLELPFADLSEATDRFRRDGAGTQRDRFVAAALDVIDAIPMQAELALHFDCRDGASFTMASVDAEAMASITQELVNRAARPVQLVHLPVPLRHEGDAFFRGLAGLRLPPPTRLCLGLIHISDGAEGARRRLALARGYLDGFAIAARSGFAARAPDVIRPFLALHAEIADDMPRTTQIQGVNA